MGEINTPSLGASIRALIESELLATHIAMPARVLEYDASQQRVSVKPIIRRGIFGEDGERVAEDIPAIEGVPVIFMGAGSIKITFPIPAGSVVWLMFSECSLDKWLTTGANDVDPDDDRRNALSDAVAIPGLLPFSDASDQTHDTAAVFAASEIRLGSKDATALLALKSDVEALKTVFDAHQHPDPSTGFVGTPTNGVGTPVTFPSPTGTTKVKAE